VIPVQKKRFVNSYILSCRTMSQSYNIRKPQNFSCFSLNVKQKPTVFPRFSHPCSLHRYGANHRSVGMEQCHTSPRVKKCSVEFLPHYTDTCFLMRKFHIMEKFTATLLASGLFLAPANIKSCCNFLYVNISHRCRAV